MRARILTPLLAFGLSAFTTPASAFCRTTICDPLVSCLEDPALCCIPDEHGCDVNTAPLFWPTSCVSYNVHEDGALGISSSELSSVLDEAFDAWLSVSCGGDGVSLAVDYRGTAQCGAPEYNLGEKDRNANVWMFNIQDDSSNVPGESTLDAATLAVTIVSFNEDTAEIYDVDVELVSPQFTVGDESIVVDLASVVTHEAGHFLGMEHSRVDGATMAAGYSQGTTDNRDLSADDEAGICAIYPSGRSFDGGQTCEPRGKYSPKCDKDGCGCRVVGARARPSLMLPLLVLALLGRKRRVNRRRAVS